MSIKIETRTFSGEVVQTKPLKPGSKIAIHSDEISVGKNERENYHVLLGRPKIITVEDSNRVSFILSKNGDSKKIILDKNVVNRSNLSFSPLIGVRDFLSQIVYKED